MPKALTAVGDSSSDGQFTNTLAAHLPRHPQLRIFTVIILGLPVAKRRLWTDIYKVYPTQSSLLDVPLAVKAPRVLPQVRGSAKARILSSVIESYAELYFAAANSQTCDNICSFQVVNTSSNTGTPAYALATPWFDNGNVFEYMSRHSNVDKFPLIMQVANGLEFLHAQGIVHGNICTDNILISDNLRACITDVGLYLLMRQVDLVTDGRLPVPTQWMFKSPEELFPSEINPSAFMHTTAMDVYSFACTVYTVCTGKTPFSFPRFAYGRGLSEIHNHGHSRRQCPAEICGNLWMLMMRCWKFNPAERPTMKEVVAELQMLV